MPGVIPLQPFPVWHDPNQKAVHANDTVTTSGSVVLTGYGATAVTLFVNVKAAPTGTAPTIQYTLQEVDPGDGTTVIGNTVSTTVITDVGIQRITLVLAYGGSVQVSWEVTGVTPSFTQVYATAVAKLSSFVTIDPATGDAYSSANPVRTDGSGTTQPVIAMTPQGVRQPDSSYLSFEALFELRQIRKLLEVLVGESFQNDTDREEM